MQDTAVSKIVNAKGAISVNVINSGEIDIIEFPNSVINKCPAIKFAVNRTHNVMGRIRFLTNSIITIKDIRT